MFNEVLTVRCGLLRMSRQVPERCRRIPINVITINPCIDGAAQPEAAARGYFFAGRSGAENCSVRSRSVMSTTVSIGAVSS